VIDGKTLQTFMKTSGFYAGAIDGIFGPMSYAGARADLIANNIAAGKWDNSRTYIALEQLFLNKVMGAGLIVDGLAGPRTNDAIYAYQSSLLQPTGTTVWPRQADVRAGTSMFGKPGQANLAQVVCPYPMYVEYDRSAAHKITHFAAHKKIVAPLQRIFARTLDYYGAQQVRELNLDINSGCYNYRPTTGSSSLSMHAWGVAIDIDSAHNEMDDSGRYAAFSKPVYAPFLRFFQDEGFISLGLARNYDWMHFQAARF
jgi:peptidoglycan hydrolase-like protein with peptidoglycan-binding domain